MGSCGMCVINSSEVVWGVSKAHIRSTTHATLSEPDTQRLEVGTTNNRGCWSQEVSFPDLSSTVCPCFRYSAFKGRRKDVFQRRFQSPGSRFWWQSCRLRVVGLADQRHGRNPLCNHAQTRKGLGRLSGV